MLTALLKLAFALLACGQDFTMLRTKPAHQATVDITDHCRLGRLERTHICIQSNQPNDVRRMAKGITERAKRAKLTASAVVWVLVEGPQQFTLRVLLVKQVPIEELIRQVEQQTAADPGTLRLRPSTMRMLLLTAASFRRRDARLLIRAVPRPVFAARNEDDIVAAATELTLKDPVWTEQCRDPLD